jgi:hypothetical protein
MVAHGHGNHRLLPNRIEPIPVETLRFFVYKLLKTRDGNREATHKFRGVSALGN